VIVKRGGSSLATTSRCEVIMDCNRTLTNSPFKDRAVRRPGLQHARLSAESCRPRALTRRIALVFERTRKQPVLQTSPNAPRISHALQRAKRVAFVLGGPKRPREMRRLFPGFTVSFKGGFATGFNRIEVSSAGTRGQASSGIVDLCRRGGPIVQFEVERGFFADVSFEALHGQQWLRMC